MIDVIFLDEKDVNTKLYFSKKKYTMPPLALMVSRPMRLRDPHAQRRSLYALAPQRFYFRTSYA
jgi:hypothetical protein